MRIDADSLVVALSRAERILAVHGDLEIPVAAIESVVEVDNPWPHMHGLRWPGAGVPDLLCIGSLRHRGQRDFTAVFGRGPATIVTVSAGAGDGAYRRIIVSGGAASHHGLEPTNAVG